jgi:hypothetical protein
MSLNARYMKMGKKLNPEYREQLQERLRLPVCRWCGRRSKVAHAKCTTHMHIADTLVEQGFPKLWTHRDLRFLLSAESHPQYTCPVWHQKSSALELVTIIHPELFYDSTCELTERGNQYLKQWRKAEKALRATDRNRIESSWLDDLP